VSTLVVVFDLSLWRRWPAPRPDFGAAVNAGARAVLADTSFEIRGPPPPSPIGTPPTLGLSDDRATSSTSAPIGGGPCASVRPCGGSSCRRMPETCRKHVEIDIDATRVASQALLGAVPPAPPPSFFDAETARSMRLSQFGPCPKGRS